MFLIYIELISKEVCFRVAYTVGEIMEKEEGLLDTVKTVLIAIIIAVIIRTFLFEPFKIPSGSMSVTIYLFLNIRTVIQNIHFLLAFHYLTDVFGKISLNVEMLLYLSFLKITELISLKESSVFPEIKLS